MIQVIGRALDILELIARNPEEPQTLSFIADQLGLNHGTCANIIKTLVNRHYIDKIDGKKGYRLGNMAYKLAGKKDYKNILKEAAQPEMERLTAKFNENTLLTVLQGNNRLAILRINSKHQVQVITPTEKEAYNSSTGRLLMALFPKNELEDYLSRYGLPLDHNGKSVSRSKLLKELEEIKQKAYAAYLPDDEILGLAVPVMQNHKAVASISIYLPAFRSTESKKTQMLKELFVSAEEISRKLSE